MDREDFFYLDGKVNSKEEYYKAISLPFRKHPLRVTFVNAFNFGILAKRKKTIGSFDFVFSDGALYCFLYNFFNDKKIIRASFDFSSLAKDVFDRAQSNNMTIALIGGECGVSEKAQANFEKLYPNIKIIYTRDGFFKSEHDERVFFDSVISLKPDIILIGMGAPLQENMVMKICNNCDFRGEIYTCGGFLEQSSLKPDYYHPIIKKSGARWLQRAIMHSHVRKRLIIDYPRFIFQYCKYHLSR